MSSVDVRKTTVLVRASTCLHEEGHDDHDMDDDDDCKVGRRTRLGAKVNADDCHRRSWAANKQNVTSTDKLCMFQ